jgi:hypothetical protein
MLSTFSHESLVEGISFLAVRLFLRFFDKPAKHDHHDEKGGNDDDHTGQTNGIAEQEIHPQFHQNTLILARKRGNYNRSYIMVIVPDQQLVYF